MHSSKPIDTFEPSAHSFPTSSSRLQCRPPLPVLTDSGIKCSNAAQLDEKQTRKRKLRRRRPGALRQNSNYACMAKQTILCLKVAYGVNWIGYAIATLQHSVQICARMSNIVSLVQLVGDTSLQLIPSRHSCFMS
jgi:hypothetical protein